MDVSKVEIRHSLCNALLITSLTGVMVSKFYSILVNVKSFLFAGEDPDFKYSIDCVSREEFKEERGSGVKITEYFKCCKHCSMAAAEANRVLGIIKNTFASREGTGTYICDLDGN